MVSMLAGKDTLGSAVRLVPVILAIVLSIGAFSSIATRPASWMLARSQLNANRITSEEGDGWTKQRRANI